MNRGKGRLQWDRNPKTAEGKAFFFGLEVPKGGLHKKRKPKKHIVYERMCCCGVVHSGPICPRLQFDS